MKLAEVKQINDISLVDVPNRLRKLADQVEQGLFGHKESPCIIAILGNELTVFGFGHDSEATKAFLILHAAADQLKESVITGYLKS